MLENATTAPTRDKCLLCGHGTYAAAADSAVVHSNVRKWSEHTTTVWRCASCASLHCLERRDLAPFYEGYPFQRRELDGWARIAFSAYIRRLRRHGLGLESHVLDYGCGNGVLVEYLRKKRFRHVVGYDPYVEGFKNTLTPDMRFDVVISQDVVEHDESPGELLRTMSDRVRSGGLLCIGTPRAEAIDLSYPELAIHSLHQPFHLHILSERVLARLAAESGLIVEKIYRRHVLDTLVPFVNWTFLRAYLQSGDNTLDAGFDSPNLRAIALSPRLLGLGLLGYFVPVRSEMLFMLRKRA